MSEKNHPNFHAVEFSMKMIEAVEACLRNKGKIKRGHVASSLKMIELITNFTFDIEAEIDRVIEEG